MRLAAGNNRQTKRKPVAELPKAPPPVDVTAVDRERAPFLVALSGSDPARRYDWSGR